VLSVSGNVATLSHRDSVADLVRTGRDLETVVLARAVRAHVEHWTLVFGNKTVVFG
jgi:formyltetrahydrofolate deformylase